MPEGPSNSDLGRRMARGTLAQQGGHVVTMVAALVAATILARELSLPEFGVYGLVVSFSAYLYFALGSAETVTVAALGGAVDPNTRDRTFTAAVAVYALLGLFAGILIASVGVAALGLLVEGDFLDQARLGALAVAGGTVLGWPAKVAQDLLRAEQRFALASLADALGNALLVAAIAVLALVVDAPLWTLIGVGATIPLFVGVVAIVLAVGAGVSARLRPSTLTWEAVRELLGMSSSMLGISASDVVISQLDRVVLAAFTSTAVLGLYEGAVRVNTVLRSFAGTFGVTLLPVLARVSAMGQTGYERELLLRGTKYVLAAVVPPTVVLMVLADRVLEVWLGPEFVDAAPAAVIFLAHWLIAPNAAFANSLLVVEREFRRLAIYAWGVALLNLALSLALTPLLGLEGVVIGTTAAYSAALPFYVRFMMRRRSISLAELARTAWLPVYGLAVVLAAALGALRLAFELDSAATVAIVCGIATVVAWAVFYLVGLDRSERRLVRRIVGIER